MSIRKALVLAALLVVTPAAARASGPAAAPAHPRATARRARAEARLERVEARIKTMRAIALANRLNLDPKTALKLNAIMDAYDGKRAGIREHLQSAMKALRKAARAPAPDAKAVDAAVHQVLAAQGRLAELRAEEAREMMQGLTPRQKARLVIFYRDFPREIRRLVRRAERLRHLRGPAPATGASGRRSRP